MKLQFEMLDVFTDTQLSGIQFPVFLNASALTDEMMQSIAREMNVSETSFLFPAREDNHALMRLFTTMTELPFAGHPSLGSAIALARTQFPNDDQIEIRLETKAGIVPVMVRKTGDHYEGTMKQPSPTITQWENGEKLLEVLGLPDAEPPVELFDNGVKHLFITTQSVEQIASVVPDYGRMLDVVGEPCVNLVCRNDAEYILRTFVFGDALPAEEPACGSASGSLATKLVRAGQIDDGQTIVIQQGQYISRPSTITASSRQTENGWDVRVGGSAVFVGTGSLDL
jgi:trans-2,3-dihydro-3-hydroxyanthranilate isomerase